MLLSVPLACEAIFINEKLDGSIGTRAWANSCTQRIHTNEDSAEHSAVVIEALITTAVIESDQRRYVIAFDISNTFVQTPVPQSEQEVIMQISGLVVDYLIVLVVENIKNSSIYRTLQ